MGDKLLLRLNIDGKPIANKYCEGKMKRTLKRGLKDLKSLRRKRYERINCHRSKRSDVSLVWVLVRQRLSYTMWSLLWFRRQKARWFQRYRNQCRKRRRFTVSFYTKRFPGMRALLRSCQDGSYWPVLKHGPRSLSHMRVCEWKNS